jgi:energy-coupling factor transporter ATP-binding protein EcfA2
MDLIRNNADETPSGDDLALVLEERPPAVGSSHGSPSAEDSHDQLRSGQSYDRITAGGSSRLHAGNIYNNNYYQPEQSTARSVPKDNDEDEFLKTFLRCLSFEQMESRLASIATAHPETCEWIVDCPQFKRWQDTSLQTEHHGCLWIKGKPGAGKSTIMKSLLRHAEAAKTDGKVVSFFFNARGALLERSTEGMYRSMLYQMAGDVPSPLTDLRLETVRLYRRQGWPLELLKDLCHKAVRHLTGEIGITFFIDALDKGDIEDDVRDMVRFFEALAAEASSDGRPLKVCLASRHYPTISVHHTEKLVLDTFKNHEKDIITYVRTELGIDNPLLRERLVSAVGARASGIFLWVVLVVKILNKEVDRGNQHLLEAKLQEIPDGLYALFDSILERDTDQYHLLLRALIWVLFAREPLKPVEAYFAIMISTGQLCSDNIIWDSDIVDHAVIVRFLL